MSHEITLWCGCRVYVSCHPQTKAVHTRIIDRRGEGCRERFHDVGARLQSRELLPRRDRSEPQPRLTRLPG
jgi:hypothetical protein